MSEEEKNNNNKEVKEEAVKAETSEVEKTETSTKVPGEDSQPSVKASKEASTAEGKELIAEGDLEEAAAKKPAPAAAKKKAAPKKPKGPEIENLVVSSSPHILTDQSVPKIMHNVIMALLPCAAAGVYFFGVPALLLMTTCIISCMVTEYVTLKMRGRKAPLHDGSAILTGLLLALTLPPNFPLFGAFLGSVFAIAVGKQLFGGLGLNIFNPALLGRAFLQATYPLAITTWSSPFKSNEAGVDVVSAATPLAAMKFDKAPMDLTDMLIGNVAGSLGETSAVLIILGGLYLRYLGYVNWRMPLGFLGGIFVFGSILNLLAPGEHATGAYHLLAGGTMLAAWFMVTDMVTSPITPKGQWIFVLGAALVTVLIRLFGGLPEGVMYSILFMNAFVPIINNLTRPKVLGEVV